MAGNPRKVLPIEEEGIGEENDMEYVNELEDIVEEDYVDDEDEYCK